MLSAPSENLAVAQISELSFEDQRQCLLAAIETENPDLAAAIDNNSSRRGGVLVNAITRMQWRQYKRAGGDTTDWIAFLQYLLENLPAIIAAIMALFA